MDQGTGGQLGDAQRSALSVGHILENYGTLRRCGSKNIKSLKFWCIPIWFMNYQDYHYQEMVPGFMKLHLTLIFTIHNFCNLFFLHNLAWPTWSGTWPQGVCGIREGCHCLLRWQHDCLYAAASSAWEKSLWWCQEMPLDTMEKNQRDTKWCYMRFKTPVDDYGGLYTKMY